MGSSAFTGAYGGGGSNITTFSSQTSVTVTHNFNTYPVVDIVDDTGAVLIPMTITHNSTTPASCTSTTVTFDVAKSGKIVLSYGATPGPKGDPGAWTTSVITGNTNAAKDYLYILTGAGTIVLTLPGSPSVNDKVGVVNLTSVLTCSVARNGNNIMGSATDLTLDKANAGFTMVYSGATNGWIII